MFNSQYLADWAEPAPEESDMSEMATAAVVDIGKDGLKVEGSETFSVSIVGMVAIVIMTYIICRYTARRK